ncbi:hypothetical protein Ato02nite_036600 [Paractinoplanes toevensis]|uniref:Uncharacterized protein n=1 Tax=Paractinoplanes toevensis TaxID=571911 RepID=A0A919TAU6_9ACTN|nr:hypothetical protein Ato02nite_036600 [Actinoplanes toevensis]
MVPAVLQPLAENAQLTIVLVVCAPLTAIVIMFVVALIRAPREKCVEAIKAMAEVARALRSGKSKQSP